MSKEEDRREVAKTVRGVKVKERKEREERKENRGKILKEREEKKSNPQIAAFYTVNNKNVKAINRKNGLPRFANERDQID